MVNVVKTAAALLLVRKTQGCLNLTMQKVEETFHIHANCIEHCLGVYGGFAVISGKEHGAAEVYDF